MTRPDRVRIPEDGLAGISDGKQLLCFSVALWNGKDPTQTDAQWKDYILFYEYFRGDNGAGLGASHQTG